MHHAFSDRATQMPAFLGQMRKKSISFSPFCAGNRVICPFGDEQSNGIKPLNNCLAKMAWFCWKKWLNRFSSSGFEKDVFLNTAWLRVVDACYFFFVAGSNGD